MKESKEIVDKYKDALEAFIQYEKDKSYWSLEPFDIDCALEGLDIMTDAKLRENNDIFGIIKYLVGEIKRLNEEINNIKHPVK